MPFNGFDTQAIEFIKKIQQNNNLEWFEAHKEEYERLIREPSRDFVVEMGEHLQALVPTINAIPKVSGSLFRIYRDIRFSKDKTPIKERIGLIFWQGNQKRMQSSSFYLHFTPTELFYAVGIRAFSPDMRAVYREYILDDKNRVALHTIYEALKSKGYEVAPQKYKRIPKGFADKSENYLSLCDGAFAFKASEDITPLYSEKVILDAYDIYEEMYELQQWVYKMSRFCDKI